MDKRLYYHKTGGGAEYLTDRWTRNPDGSKEGVFKNARIIVRIDGDIRKDAKITLADELFAMEDRQVTQAEKLDAIAALYEAVYNATESFCEGGDMVGQTLYLIGAIVNGGTIELTRNDPYRKFLHGIFPADSWIWNLVEDTD